MPTSSEPVAWSKLTELAELLRSTRKSRGITQQQVAAVIDLPVGLYDRIERARMMPLATTLETTCQFLGLDYDAVVTRMASEDDATLD